MEWTAWNIFLYHASQVWLCRWYIGIRIAVIVLPVYCSINGDLELKLCTSLWPIIQMSPFAGTCKPSQIFVILNFFQAHLRLIPTYMHDAILQNWQKSPSAVTRIPTLTIPWPRPGPNRWGFHSQDTYWRPQQERDERVLCNNERGIALPGYLAQCLGRSTIHSRAF